MKKILIPVLLSICSLSALFAQNYDESFSRPIVTENGRFIYYELPPINTSEGVLIFLDRNLGATSNDVFSSDSWGDLYQWGRPTDGHEKRNSKITAEKAITITSVTHGLFVLDEKRANDWVSTPTSVVWQSHNQVNNPCPCGYRLPSQKEWNAILSLGYEVEQNKYGFHALSIDHGALVLPASGLRNAHNGFVLHSGTRGYYWSQSTERGGTSGTLDFNSEDRLGRISLYGYRAFGRSIRCLRKL